MNSISNPALSTESKSDWQRFFNLLNIDPSIKTEILPHYTRWVGYWLNAKGDKSEEATAKFFEALGRHPNLHDWQFRQAVAAIERWARQIAQLPWANTFDWTGLAAQAVALESDHRTLLRETRQVPAFKPCVDDHIPVPGEAEAIAELITKVRQTVRLLNMAITTERTYVYWITRFCKFRMRKLKQVLAEFDEDAVSQYLEFLSITRQVSASTQKQALNALVFLGKRVHKLEEINLTYIPARRSGRRPPTIMTRDEVKKVICRLEDPWQLIAQLLYGSGLRVSEGMMLRVKDIDFGQGTITVHDGKGGKHRIVPLPKALESRLKEHLKAAQERHKRDLDRGLGHTHMPDSLGRKYPNAATEWAWQFVFAAAKLCAHPRTGHIARYHLHEKSMQRRFKDAVRRSSISKRVSCHTLRHCFATHLLEGGVDIRTVQDLMGHSDVSTTMIYLHVMKKPGAGAPSPLDLS